MTPGLLFMLAVVEVLDDMRCHRQHFIELRKRLQ
jgi:hypothetical protein